MIKVTPSRQGLTARTFQIILFLTLLIAASQSASAQLSINEFMAANGGSSQDPQGESDDWIEIHNSGPASVDLVGMYLTDNLAIPTLHKIPSGFTSQTTILVGGRLVLWADNDTVDGPLHLGFKLSASGEAIGLIDTDGQTILDSVVFGPQESDISYGRLPDGAASWRYFSGPTPGTANTGGYIAEVEDTKFEPDRGFYYAPFSLTIATLTDGATIRYTLDGSEPDETTSSLTYTGPIAISTTAIVRAAAFKTGWKPTNIDTHTYIFPDKVKTQSPPANYPAIWGAGETADYEMDPDVYDDPAYSSDLTSALLSIPTMSIVTDKDHLFDPTTGIYMNTKSEGEAWERPASIEYFDPRSADEFQQNCGIRIQGGASRTPNKSPKHSFRLLFKGDYGPTKLRFPFFGEAEAQAFDTLILRAGYNNSWIHWNGTDGNVGVPSGQRARAQYIRDQWARDTQLAMGQASPHGKFVHLYVNGLYWGLYNSTERPQASFGANYYGGQKEEWDALNSSAVIDGNKTAWNEAQAIANAGVVDSVGYDALAQYVDIPNLIDYMLVELFGNNADWDNHNWYSARHRIDGAGYKFFCWDTERIFENPSNTNKISVNAGDKPSRFYGALRQNREFMMQFADHAHRWLFNGGALTPEATLERWMALHNEIELAIICESARWGDYRRDVNPRTSGPYDLYTKNTHWLPEHNRIITTVLPNRTNTLINAFRSVGLYPAIDAPIYNINGSYQHGGAIAAGDSLTMSKTAPSGTIYYTLDGSDPRVSVSGTVGLSNSAIAYTGSVALSNTLRVKSRVKDGSLWSALNEAVYTLDTASPIDQLRITEIMINPAPPAPASSFNNDDFEFIELKNTGAQTLDLEGVGFTDGVATTIGLVFNYQNHVLLAPGEYAVLVSNQEAFESRYGTDIRVLGTYKGSLDNKGERLRLTDADGTHLVAFEYDNARGWPQAAHGAGHSLVPKDAYLASSPSGSLYYGGNWRASAFIGGSPGADDPSPASGIILNEIAAHTDHAPSPPDSNDWIELRNPTAADITLNDCYLSDDINNLTKWAIPNGTEILAGGLFSFDEINDFHNPTGFGLNKAGERVILSHLPGSDQDRVLDEVRFKGQENGATLGRVANLTLSTGPEIAAWQTQSPTRDAPNAAIAQDLVISQIMYHPSGDINTNEYIEIHNPTDQAIDLWNLTGYWRLNGGISLDLTTNVTIPPGDYLLFVGFDPSDTAALNAFKTAYDISDDSVTMIGPFTGDLSNRVERIALERPQEPDVLGQPISWVIVDEVIYFEQAPFPVEADGTGYALHRRSLNRSGNDPVNWRAAAPRMDQDRTPAPSSAKQWWLLQ